MISYQKQGDEFMNVPHQKINIDINRRIAQSVYIIKNSNDIGTRFVDVTLYADSEVFDISGSTVTANMVTEGFLIAEDISCEVNSNIITVQIDGTDPNFQRSGLMLVELKIADSDNVLMTPIAFKVRVTPSIIFNAQISEKSLGTTAEIIQEIAAARGNYATLAGALSMKANTVDVNAALSEKADKSTTLSGYGITDAYTKIEIDTKLSGKLDKMSGSITTDNIASKAVTAEKLGEDVTNQFSKLKGDLGDLYCKVVGGLVSSEKSYTFDSNVIFDSSYNESTSSIRKSTGVVELPKNSKVLKYKLSQYNAPIFLFFDNSRNIIQYDYINGTNVSSPIEGTANIPENAVYFYAVYGGGISAYAKIEYEQYDDGLIFRERNDREDIEILKKVPILYLPCGKRRTSEYYKRVFRNG